MIRVTRTEEQSRTLITVDGELSCDSIALIDTCCNQAALRGQPVHLHLRDITTVDRAGQTLLRRLIAKGVPLVADGVYTSYLIQALCSDNAMARRDVVEADMLH
jgi:hypothetical protein